VRRCGAEQIDSSLGKLHLLNSTALTEIDPDATFYRNPEFNMTSTAEWSADCGEPDPFRATSDERHAYRSKPPLVAANDNAPAAWILRDADGKAIQVVRAARKNPLLCRPYQARPAIPDTILPEDRQRVVRRILRQALAANDSDIMPRAPRNIGAHPDLVQWLPQLSWWRQMTTNAPPHVPAANDNKEVEGLDVNSAIRPSVQEIVDRLPKAVREDMAARQSDSMAGPAPVREAAEWRNGRIAQLGGLKFETGCSAVDAHANVPENDNHKDAGTLVAYERRNGKWSRPADGAGERSASATSGPVDAIFAAKLDNPDALPKAPVRLAELFLGFPRVGAKSREIDGELSGTGVRGAVPIAEGDDTESANAFRRAFSGHALVLDMAMTAGSVSDVAAAVGKVSSAAGKRALVAACDALQKFRNAEIAPR
jgi:hypothetical protein